MYRAALDSYIQDLAQRIKQIPANTYKGLKQVEWAQHYATLKGVVSQIDWVEVLKITVFGFLSVCRGVYLGGYYTGRFVHTSSQWLGHEMNYLMGNLHRPPASTDHLRGITEMVADPAPLSPTSTTGPTGLEEVTFGIRDQYSSEEADTISLVVSPEVLEMIDEIATALHAEMSEQEQSAFSMVMDPELDPSTVEELVVALTPQPLQGNPDKTVDSICSVAVMAPISNLVKGMTVRELKEISGVRSKKYKKDQLIVLAGAALAC